MFTSLSPIIAKVPMNVVFGIPSEKVIFISFILLGCLFFLGLVSGLIVRFKETTKDFAYNVCLIIGLFQMFALFDLFLNCTKFGESVIFAGYYIFLIPLFGMVIIVFGILLLGVSATVLCAFIDLLLFFAGTFLGDLIRRPFSFSKT